MNIMSIIKSSKVNGPGNRMVIWTQGCSKKCPNCYQPESWPTKLNEYYSPLLLAYMVKEYNPEGLTLTGGDPLEQPEELFDFLELVQPSQSFLPKGIICFTGYTIEEIEELPKAKACLPYIDLLIEGRYVDSLRVYNGLRGSENQRFIWNQTKGRGKDLIGESKIVFDQNVEVHVENGEICVTGFPALTKENRQYLKKLGVEIRNS